MRTRPRAEMALAEMTLAVPASSKTLSETLIELGYLAACFTGGFIAETTREHDIPWGVWCAMHRRGEGFGRSPRRAV